MYLKQITVRLRRFREIAQKTDDANIHNTCMNRISVLEIMEDRWFNEWYDEESDFRAQYENTVDDMIESDDFKGVK